MLPEIKWREEEELPREVMEKLVVRDDDFENALRVVEPSAMREVLIEVPKVKWEDVGGLDKIKQELSTADELTKNIVELTHKLTALVKKEHELHTQQESLAVKQKKITNDTQKRELLTFQLKQLTART